MTSNPPAASAQPHTMVELTDESSSSPAPEKPRNPEIDVSTLSEADQEFYRRYGRLPNNAAQVKRRETDKKQFDSADYFMAAEKAKSGMEAGGGGAPPKSLPPHMRKKVPPHLR